MATWFKQSLMSRREMNIFKSWWCCRIRLSVWLWCHIISFIDLMLFTCMNYHPTPFFCRDGWKLLGRHIKMLIFWRIKMWFEMFLIYYRYNFIVNFVILLYIFWEFHFACLEGFWSGNIKFLPSIDMKLLDTYLLFWKY